MEYPKSTAYFSDHLSKDNFGDFFLGVRLFMP